MNRKVWLIVLVLVAVDFAALSGYALLQHGYWGLFEYQFASPAGWQVLADLAVACLLAAGWMVQDARRTGRTVWPYLVATVALGSFGLLAYVLIGLLSARPDRRAVLA